MLNNQNVIPLYQQIENDLRHKIQTGEYPPDMRLPSEAELAVQFQVSTITVKKALLNLVDQGLLKRKQGKGTFVLSAKQNRDMRQIVSFSQTCKLNGTVPGSKTLEQCIIEASLAVKEALERNEDTAVFIKRLRYVDGKPMAIESNWFPMAFYFFLQEDLDNKSLFDVMYQKASLTLYSARRSIEICYADHQESQLLEVRKGTALLLVRSTVYDTLGVPVFYGKQIINADHFKVIV